MREFFVSSVFFGVTLSIAGYQIGLFLKKKWKAAVFNPLLISIIFVITALLLLNVEYEEFNEGAKYLSYFLTPATVCLALPLYRQFEILKKNIKAISAGILSGVVSSLASIWIFSLLFGFSHQQYVTLLPKSVTTAIGMVVAEEAGGVAAIAAAAIIITGVFGNMSAEFICRVLRIQEPVAQGLAMGTSAHAIGTAKAMEFGEVQGAMSSLAIVVSGLLTVVLVPVFAHFF